MPVEVGKRAMVHPFSFGAREERTGGGVTTVRVAMPCVCESINEQGIACLAFTTNGGIIRECFKLGDPALDVRWK